MRVTAPPWSYSKLALYEQCPLRAALTYAPGPRVELPRHPAAARGDEVHAELERWLKSRAEQPIPTIAVAFSEPLMELRKTNAVAEADWYFASDWTPTTRPNRWMTMKLDVSRIDGKTATVIDYKTGRVYDNHEGQVKLYALGAMRRHDKVKRVKVELWYLDQARIREDEYAAKDADALRTEFEQRLKTMLDDDECEPKPNPFCRWCPFSREAGGPCPAA